MKSLLLILLLTGCGANARWDEYETKDPCVKKRGPDVCVKENGEWKCSHDREVE